jgi:hypothetical protein
MATALLCIYTPELNICLESREVAGGVGCGGCCRLTRDGREADPDVHEFVALFHLLFSLLLRKATTLV